MNNKNTEDLAVIRALIEQSSRFISLSGWSGVLAGIYGFCAAGLASYWLRKAGIDYFSVHQGNVPATLRFQFFVLGLATLLLAVITGILLTIRKSKKKGLKLWTKVTRRMVIHLFVPLVAGGLFCLALLLNDHIVLIPATMLIFYGLALLNAGKFTLRDIAYLGYFELILGLVALFIPGYGLLFWTVGFGLLHIVYGISMQIKHH